MKKIISILALVLFVSCKQEKKNTKSTKENRGYKVRVGEQAPKLSFSLLDGTKITNQSLLGKTVVLQFTASWCKVCIKEMPHLEKEVWQEFKNENFVLIGIDLKEGLNTVKQFIKQTKVTYPFTIDTDGSIFDLFTLEGAGVTRNIVIDKTGKIIFLTRLFNEKEFKDMISVIRKNV